MVVVVINIEDDVFGRMRLLDKLHLCKGLVDAVSPDPKVLDRLTQMSGQVFLPGLPVTDLVQCVKLSP